MLVGSERWGTVGVGDDRVFTFPEGLVGFDGPLRLALIDDGPRLWLQSVEDPALAFSALVPWDAFPDYEPVLPLEDQVALELEREEDALVLCLVAGGAGATTVNLRGPLVLNRRSRLGRQVVLLDADWPVRAPMAA